MNEPTELAISTPKFPECALPASIEALAACVQPVKSPVSNPGMRFALAGQATERAAIAVRASRIGRRVFMPRKSIMGCAAVSAHGQTRRILLEVGEVVSITDNCRVACRKTLKVGKPHRLWDYPTRPTTSLLYQGVEAKGGLRKTCNLFESYDGRCEFADLYSQLASDTSALYRFTIKCRAPLKFP